MTGKSLERAFETRRKRAMSLWPRYETKELWIALFPDMMETRSAGVRGGRTALSPGAARLRGMVNTERTQLMEVQK